jgi:predicted DNA-binding protein (MmcQ/YjbR family)
MNIEELREYCLSLKGTEEGLPFGPDTLVLKVCGKMFLLCGMEHSPLQFNVKCDPEKAMQLREEYSCVIPGYHMSKKHWNTVIADGTVSDNVLRSWINDSYNLVVGSLPKAEKAKLNNM